MTTTDRRMYRWAVAIGLLSGGLFALLLGVAV